MSVEQTIQQIALAHNEDIKIDLFNQIKSELTRLHDRRKERYIITLLYDSHWYIRQEAAFLIDQLGLKLSGEDYFRYLLALQDFENLFLRFSDPMVRKIIFETLKDPNHRLRSKIFKYLKFDDCTTWQEQALFWYGQAEYQELIPLAEHDSMAKEYIEQLLRFGMKNENNPDYHRRRCAETLQQLEDSGALQAFITDLLNDRHASPKKAANTDLRPVPLHDQEPDLNFRLQTVIAKLKEKGIWVDGQLIFPQIQIGSRTNRITYRNPGLQTWPKAEREKRIAPPPDTALLAFDFISMEPTLVLHFLLQNFYLALDEIPEDDIYLAFYPENREKSKRFLNTLINGGGLPSEALHSSFALKFVQGLTQLRLEQMSLARQRGFVETIAGNRIPIETQTPNFSGKVVNRLIQGSASDIFNEALCAIQEKYDTNAWPLQVYFVIFDELWLAAPQKKAERWFKEANEFLNRFYQKFQLLAPLKCRGRILKTEGDKQ